MKLIMEKWRRFQEALEYDQDESNKKSQFTIPSDINRLKDEVAELDLQVQAAYEQGDPNAENLDAEFAEKQYQLETALSELEDEPLTGDTDKDYTTRDSSDLMRQFSNLFYHFIEGVPYQGMPLTRIDLIEKLRYIAQDYGWEHGGFKETTSDQDLFDAAEDSYRRLKRLRKPLKRL